MSRIKWTETTWNPVTGCGAVSEGCRNCYAAAMTKRLASMEKRQYMDLINRAGHFNGRIRLIDQRLEQPLRWRRPRRIFVNSMSDLFHPDVPVEFIARVFAVMSLANWHQFQILTKRPDRMADVLASAEFQDAVTEASEEFDGFADEQAQRFGLVDVLARVTTDWRATVTTTLPLSNVWLGTSVENQAAADERIPHLLRCPAAVRFLSCEPLLGPIDLGYTFTPAYRLAGGHPAFDWVIVGGESGPGARDCCVDEIESIISQCRVAGVPCFVKQLGARPILGDLSHPHGWPTSHMPVNWETGRIQLRHPKGGDPAEWPDDLHVREYPKTNPAAVAGNTQET